MLATVREEPDACLASPVRILRPTTGGAESDPQPESRRREGHPALVREADVFGQNFRPGAAEKNGFGYETLKQVNPRIVYVSISGYGPRGPHAMLPGTDAMAQALGGIAEAFATPGHQNRYRLSGR